MRLFSVIHAWEWRHGREETGLGGRARPHVGRSGSGGGDNNTNDANDGGSGGCLQTQAGPGLARGVQRATVLATSAPPQKTARRLTSPCAAVVVMPSSNVNMACKQLLAQFVTMPTTMWSCSPSSAPIFVLS